MTTRLPMTPEILAQFESNPGSFVLVDDRGVPLVLPNRLYKFMERKWADAMIQQGSYRIGTLHEYRDEERHSEGVLGQGEGTLSHHEVVTLASPQQISKVSRLAISGGPGSLIENVTIKVEFNLSNQYIYCFSLSADWNNEIHSNYDVCVEIAHPDAFLFGLSQEMISRGLAKGFDRFGNVQYVGREHQVYTNQATQTGALDLPDSPAFIKPESFARQQEYRVTFQPLTAKVMPVIGQSRFVRASVRLHRERPS